MISTRRSLITGLVSLIAAPAVVRAASLMPVRGIVMPVKYVTATEIMARRRYWLAQMQEEINRSRSAALRLFYEGQQRELTS